MGFNRRYVDKKSLNRARKLGVNYLIKYVTNSDCLIMLDDFSRNVVKIIKDSSDEIDTIAQLQKIDFD